VFPVQILEKSVSEYESTVLACPSLPMTKIIAISPKLLMSFEVGILNDNSVRTKIRSLRHSRFNKINWRTEDGTS